MFNNLIESSSHKGELKRRGSFFLFTTATYALLFAIAGAASIYAYDARLAEQNLEVVTMMSPVDFPVIKPATPEHEANSPRNDSLNKPVVDERREAMLSVDHPEVAPERISTAANPTIPIRDEVPYLITGRDRNAELPGGSSGSGRDGGRVAGPGPMVVEVTTPPPARTKTKATRDKQGPHHKRSLVTAKTNLPDDGQADAFTG